MAELSLLDKDVFKTAKRAEADLNRLCARWNVKVMVSDGGRRVTVLVPAKLPRKLEDVVTF